jgi:hypothetical protein
MGVRAKVRTMTIPQARVLGELSQDFRKLRPWLLDREFISFLQRG